MVERTSDPSPALHRHVEPTRRRQLWWWALAGTAAANAALTIAVAARPSGGGFAVAVTVQPAPPPVAPAVIVQPAPVVVQGVVPAPPQAAAGRAAFAELGPCPAPYGGATRGAVTQPSEYGGLVGVAPSPTDSRLVAAWSDEEIFVSRDGGHTWGRVLDGDGRVLDASFDCHGRVIALRDRGGLGVREGAREVWRPVAGIALAYSHAPPDGDGDGAPDGPDPDAEDPFVGGYRPQLVGGGRAIGVIGGASGDASAEAHLVAITDDSGASWRRVDLGWYDGGRVSAEWEGDTLRAVLPWTDCMSEGVNVLVVTPGGARTIAIDEYDRAPVLAGGAVLAGPYACDPQRASADGAMCVWRGDRWTLKPGPQPTGGDDDPGHQLIDGPVDVMRVGESIYRVDARGFGRGRAWEETWEPVTTDRAGRPWGVESGLVMRAPRV